MTHQFSSSVWLSIYYMHRVKYAFRTYAFSKSLNCSLRLFDKTRFEMTVSTNGILYYYD